MYNDPPSTETTTTETSQGESKGEVMQSPWEEDPVDIYNDVNRAHVDPH